METDKLIGESVILKLTVEPWRTPIEVITITGQRYSDHISENGEDASRCKTYTCRCTISNTAGRTWTLDNDFIVPLLEQLRTISFPILPKLVPPGKDGVYYKLEIGLNQAPRIEFKWWSRIPEGWEPLAEIAQQLRKHAKDNLQRSTE